jgi:Na+/proline symporter
MVLSLYWKKMTGPAAIAGMLGGTMTHLGLTCWGYLKYQEFRAYEFVGLNPFIWDLAGSIIACLVVVWIGPKASRRLVERFF